MFIYKLPKILILTCFVQMISMVGFAIWPIYLIDLQAQWKLSNSEAGWISGSFYIGYVIATPFLVSLTDTFDSRKLYAISCLIGSAGLFFFLFFQQMQLMHQFSYYLKTILHLDFLIMFLYLSKERLKELYQNNSRNLALILTIDSFAKNPRQSAHKDLQKSQLIIPITPIFF